MGINWKIRLRHPAFYTALIGFIGFIVADSGVMELGKFEMYAELFFGLLVAAGVITDLTTPGVTDSQLSLQKDEPTNGEDMQNGSDIHK